MRFFVKIMKTSKIATILEDVILFLIFDSKYVVLMLFKNIFAEDLPRKFTKLLNMTSFSFHDISVEK